MVVAGGAPRRARVDRRIAAHPPGRTLAVRSLLGLLYVRVVHRTPERPLTMCCEENRPTVARWIIEQVFVISNGVLFVIFRPLAIATYFPSYCIMPLSFSCF